MLRVQNELLAQRSDELMRLNAEKDRFFSIVSHDVRSPFAAVIAGSQLVAKLTAESEDARLRIAAETVHQAARSVYGLLDNLLAWSRLHGGRMTYDPEPLVLVDEVTAAVRPLEANASAKRIRVSVNVGENIRVTADRNFVRTITRNLVGNALKFSPPGAEVRVWAEPTSTRRVKVTVEDQGLGMGPSEVAALFRSSVNRSTPGTASEQGSGLGLVICRDMAEREGGALTVDTAPGEGARFSFTLGEFVEKRTSRPSWLP